MCSLCRLPVTKNRNFGQILTFGGSCTDPLLPIRAKFGVLEQTQCLHLHAKYHLSEIIVSASGGQKLQFWANCDFCGLLYRPLLPMRAKFGMLEQTQGLHLQAKCHLNVFIVSASGGQKPQFWANLTLGAPVPTTFYRRGPNLVYQSRPKVYTLTGKLSPECVHCVGFRWPITTILGKF